MEFVSIAIQMLISSAVLGVISLLLAKYFGKIDKATYGNTFLISLIYTLTSFLVGFIVGMIGLKFEGITVYIINIILLSASFIVFGKLIWKSRWMQSVKASIIIIAIYALYFGYKLI